MIPHSKTLGLLCAIILFIVTRTNRVDGLQIEDIRNEFLQVEDGVWFEILEGTNGNTSNIITLFEYFYKKLQQMPNEPTYGINSLETKPAYAQLYYNIHLIHDLFENFNIKLATMKYKQQTNKREWRHAIIDNVLEDYNNVEKVTKTTQDYARKSFKNDIFNIKNDDMCNYKQSKAQLMYNLYNIISKTYLKGYIMVQCSYMILRLYEIGKYTENSTQAREAYETRARELHQLWQAIYIPNHLWKCDPKNHVEGTTYGQLTNFLQAQIENEADLNSRGTCTKTCNDYSDTTSHGCYDSKSDYCKRRKRCNGSLYNCKYISSQMDVCISQQHIPRRYDYIKTDNGEIMGNTRPCWSSNAKGWLRWFVRCNYCVCICEDHGRQSDKYFSLHKVLADVGKNRVITGVQFTKKNRIIHLQIQQGKLLPYGNIDEKTIEWVPVEQFQITDGNRFYGVDYHVMTWNEREMDLNKIILGKNEVLTGLRMDMERGVLTVRAYFAPINFISGTVGESRITNRVSASYKKVDLSKANVPTMTPDPSLYNSECNKIEFTYTDFKKDVSQTTVPFLDLQSVAPEPPAPLSGFRLYYKGRNGYGGFVGPMLYTFNYEDHINGTIPQMKDRNDYEPIVEENFNVELS